MRAGQARTGCSRAIAANLLLHGNAYVQLIADDRDAPAELCPAAAGAGERGGRRARAGRSAYLYRAGGRSTRIDRLDALGRRQVAHMKALHPRDDHYGMGCLEAAIAGGERSTIARRGGTRRCSTMRRGRRGALSYEPADGSVLSAEQFKRLKDELAAEFSGSGNAGRPLLLEGGLKWQALSLTPGRHGFRRR